MIKIKWFWPVFFLPVFLLMGCPKSPTAPNSALVENPYNAADPLTGYNNVITSSGFYIQPYPGSSMSSVVLWLLVNKTGSYTYNLTVTDSSYTGSVIGTASSGAVSLLDKDVYQAVMFTFGGNPGVTKGHTVDFVVNATSSPSGSITSFCPQASGSDNVNIELTNGTSGSTPGPNQGTGVAVVINGNS